MKFSKRLLLALSLLLIPLFSFSCKKKNVDAFVVNDVRNSEGWFPRSIGTIWIYVEAMEDLEVIRFRYSMIVGCENIETDAVSILESGTLGKNIDSEYQRSDSPCDASILLFSSISMVKAEYEVPLSDILRIPRYIMDDEGIEDRVARLTFRDKYIVDIAPMADISPVSEDSKPFAIRYMEFFLGGGTAVSAEAIDAEIAWIANGKYRIDRRVTNELVSVFYRDGVGPVLSVFGDGYEAKQRLGSSEYYNGSNLSGPEDNIIMWSHEVNLSRLIYFFSPHSDGSSTTITDPELVYVANDGSLVFDSKKFIDLID